MLSLLVCTLASATLPAHLTTMSMYGYNATLQAEWKLRSAARKEKKVKKKKGRGPAPTDDGAGGYSSESSLSSDSDADEAMRKAAKPVEKRDRFGRVIEQRVRGTKRPASGLFPARETKESLPVRFKFHEGVTDAVRRPVKVRDLL